MSAAKRWNYYFQNRERTDYGIRMRGKSFFVIIAPHAAGDDKKTGRIARKIARLTDGYLIINKFYFKPTNSKAKSRPERVEDFNKLSWSVKQERYLWNKKKPAKRNFYRDVANFCDEAKERSQEEKAVAIYVHGMKDNEIGIDIGVGLRAENNNFRFMGSRRSDYYCSGVATIKISQAKKIKIFLQEKVKKKYNLSVGIGKLYPAWSKRIAIQFHKYAGRNDYAIQLEINNLLKSDKTAIIFIAKLISVALKEVFIPKL